MAKKEDYLPYLSEQEVKDLERVCGKDWEMTDIPKYRRNEIEEQMLDEMDIDDLSELSYYRDFPRINEIVDYYVR